MVLAELTNGDPDYGIAIRLGVLALLLVAARSRSICCRGSAALLVISLFVFGLPFADSDFSGIAAAEIVGSRVSRCWRFS
jgi:hypothetical protein